MKPKLEMSAAGFIKALESGTGKDLHGKPLDFFSTTTPKNIIISDIEVKDFIEIESLSFEHKIVITDCNFTDVFITLSNFRSGLIFSNNTCKGDFQIERTIIKGNFHFEENAVTNEIVISKTNVGISSVRITENTAKEIWLDRCELGSQVWLDKNSAKLNITECELKSLSIWDVQDKLYLNISDSTIEKIILDGLINYGYMQWNHLRVGTIELEECVMGKWDLVNCDFYQSKLTIYSSKITDTFYTNTRFPDKICVPSKFTQKQSKHDILRDGYNQLKTIAQKQNDRRMFLHYQAAELESYFRTISFKETPATWFQLFAMKWSNDFGTKWTWGVVFVLVVNLLMVSLSYCFRPLQINAEGVGNFLSGYLSSISSLITVPKYFQSNWEVNWFYIGRIPLAFGIYQTIAAFRKFGKSE